MKPDRAAHAEWMDAFFASYYRHRPVSATFIGEHGLDDRLPDFSDQGLGDLLADTQDLLRRSQAGPGSPEPGVGGSASRSPEPSAPDSAFGTDVLTSSERIDRVLARGFLKLQLWELDSEHFQRGNPSLYTGEAVFGVMSLLLTDFGPLAARVDAATARMAATPELLAQARDNVRTAPIGWTERAIRECDGALAFFTEGATRVAAGLPRDSAFLAAAQSAARAFSEHRTHLESELSSSPSDHYACGPEALDAYLRDGHFLQLGAEEIAQYAEARMADAVAYLKAHAPDFGASTAAEALAGLRDLHPAADQYYASYQSAWDDVRRIAEQKDLLTWPDFPMRYVPRPAWARAAAPYLYFLFYRSPAAFNRPRVHDYLVAPIPEGDPTDFLRSNNSSVIKLNHVIHHGGLGHHVQNWHAFRAESRIGRVAAVDCASRIAMFCGGTMAEGWACYATDLAAEAGALTDLERYAEVHSRVRMAARAVVDVRLHLGEMTLDQAATYYETRAGMSEQAARQEAVKNSMFPGAALMYLMGTDGIHELRQKVKRRDGASFDLCHFHDTLLSYGSIPVPLIAEDMMRSEDHAD